MLSLTYVQQIQFYSIEPSGVIRAVIAFPLSRYVRVKKVMEESIDCNSELVSILRRDYISKINFQIVPASVPTDLASVTRLGHLLKLLATYFLTKVAQIFVQFLGDILKKTKTTFRVTFSIHWGNS